MIYSEMDNGSMLQRCLLLSLYTFQKFTDPSFYFRKDMVYYTY